MEGIIGQKKKDFLMEQFFLAAWSAAVRRNKIWSNETEVEKNDFIKKVWRKVKEFIENYSPEKHQIYLEELKKLELKKHRTLGIGKAQKILNLMCKYCWCVGWISEPPHLVIDSQIINELAKDNDNRELSKIKWTKMNDKVYKKLINTAQKKAKDQNCSSSAAWELQTWESSFSKK